jgi:hypothetical protein
MRVCIYDDVTAYHCDETQATGWATLAYWNVNDVSLPGSPLLQGDAKHFAILFRIPESFGNEVANKTITDMSFVVTGTQVP